MWHRHSMHNTFVSVCIHGTSFMFSNDFIANHVTVRSEKITPASAVVKLFHILWRKILRCIVSCSVIFQCRVCVQRSQTTLSGSTQCPHHPFKLNILSSACHLMAARTFWFVRDMDCFSSAPSLSVHELTVVLFSEVLSAAFEDPVKTVVSRI